MYLLFAQIRRTVYSADDEAHKQQFSINKSLLIAISTFVNETYSPPRNLTRSFFRSTMTQCSINSGHQKPYSFGLDDPKRKRAILPLGVGGSQPECKKRHRFFLPIILIVPFDMTSPISPVEKYRVPLISLKLVFSFSALPKYPAAITFPPIRISPRGFGLSVFL